MPYPSHKYTAFPPIDLPDRRWPEQCIQQAPLWCSVDLRDGNQALAVPMNIEQKLKLFHTLVAIGFKEIEVGFPSASQTEFDFCRHLIDEQLIPEDVSIQVLVQAREHLIRKTFEAIAGAPKAIIHIYNSTNPLQRRVTFNLSKSEIKNLAIEGTQLIKELTSTVPETQVRLEYSPESFSETELDYALEVCEAVMDVWQPSPQDKIILNLPATVERATPNIYADQIEWFIRHMKQRDAAWISLHTHNDRGTGIAATELGLMAGADRVEGTLFGNGERTGNLDIVTVALNLYSQGIDPQLDLSDIKGIRTVYEEATRMTVHERHPYAGDLVFTAFSGSHQDAIKKGMAEMAKQPQALYQVPYLPIDPGDIGRTYKAIIRINSQSGKGGVAYILEHEFGLDLPKSLQAEFGEQMNLLADAQGRELSSEEIHQAFCREYIDREDPLKLQSYTITKESDSSDTVMCSAHIIDKGTAKDLNGRGNGPIAALVEALAEGGLKHFRLVDFREHAITGGSNADAAAYIAIEATESKGRFWGVGIDPNIERAGFKALVSAVNRARQQSA